MKKLKLKKETVCLLIKDEISYVNGAVRVYTGIRTKCDCDTLADCGRTASFGGPCITMDPAKCFSGHPTCQWVTNECNFN